VSFLIIKRFICAVQFLTRLPAWPPVKVDSEDFARCMAFFPVVGLLTGTFLAGAFWLVRPVLIPASIAAVIILVEVAVTGALHLDGFMDTMDGLFCGRTRERRLEILRDSRVGAHSVVSVVVLLLLKWSLLLQLQQQPAKLVMAALLVMPAAGRLNIVLATYFFPYVRREGLGKAFADSLKLQDVIFALATAVSSGGLLLGPQGIIVTAGTIVAAVIAAAAVTRLLGGFTGDVYGWINEGSEVVWLLFFLFAV